VDRGRPDPRGLPRGVLEFREGRCRTSRVGLALLARRLS